jgi:hypothetical protein
MLIVVAGNVDKFGGYDCRDKEMVSTFIILEICYYIL